MVVSEIIIALTVAYLGPKRSYRLVLKGERYLFHKSLLRNWLCRRRREGGLAAHAACDFPQCQCFPHLFIRRIFHGAYRLMNRSHLRRTASELNADRGPDGSDSRKE
jgi:hypothetical protein